MQDVIDELNKLLDSHRRLTFVAAWALVGRNLGQAIPKQVIQQAADQLLKDKRIRRRGKLDSPLVLVQRDTTPESELMPIVGEWLRETWLLNQRPPASVEGGEVEIIDRLLQDTHAGRPPAGGRFRQPDFIAVFVYDERTALSRSIRNEAVSFELKRADARAFDDAVLEAVSHHRYVHRAYLIWHDDEAQFTARDLEYLKAECVRAGLGLITLRGELESAVFVTHCDSLIKQQSNNIVDAFLKDRLDPRNLRRLQHDGENDAG